MINSSPQSYKVMKTTIVVILLILPMLLANATIIQLTGSATVNVGQTTTYSYVSTTGIIIIASWTVSPGRGTIVNRRKVGTTYYADVQWTQAGIATVTLSNDGEVDLANLNVTINSTSPTPPGLLTGLATVAMGVTTTYSFVPASDISPVWTMSPSRGTIVNPRKVGTTYYADIQWTQAGVTTITLSNNGQTDIATINVTITAPVQPVLLTGLATVTQGDITTYSYASAVDIVSPYWSMSINRGTISNQRKVNIGTGTIYYYADVQWTQAGTTAVSLSSNQGITQIAYTNVTINPAPVPLVGQTTVNEGEITNYSYVSTGIIAPVWTVSPARGTVLNSWKSGTTYYADIQWTQAGSAKVSLSNDGEVELANLNITINSTTPVTTFLFDEQCGGTSITRNSSPVSGREWFWQTSPTGTSTSIGNGVTIMQTTSGEQYYLRTRMTSSGAWTGSLPVGNVNVYNMPPAPVTATHGVGFSDASITLSVNSVSGAAGYKWYTVNSGGTAIDGATTNSYTIANLAATLTYYVTSVAGPCENSARLPVTATLEPAPIIYAIGNRSLTMGEPVILGATTNYGTYSWRNSWGEIIGTQNELSVTQPGKYFLVVTKTGVSGSGINKFNVESGLSGQNLNYIVTNTIQQDDVTDINSVVYLSAKSNSQNIQYFDGLGRPMQVVNTQGSPDGKDVVQPVVYDEYGREAIKYLPYVSTEHSGWYKNSPVGASDTYNTSPHHSFYNNLTDNVVDDSNPYAITIFEPSPLNRVLKQGAPGAPWQPDGNNTYNSPTDKTIKHSYELNTANEVLYFTYNNNTGLLNLSKDNTAKYYNAYQLHVNKTKDEHNNEVIEYIDNMGHTLCKKVQYDVDTNSAKLYAATYYIYDDSGNLVFVVPPEAVKEWLLQN